jgi:hypothetical protein
MILDKITFNEIFKQIKMTKIKITNRNSLLKSAGILSLCLFPFSEALSSEPKTKYIDDPG